MLRLRSWPLLHGRQCLLQLPSRTIFECQRERMLQLCCWAVLNCRRLVHSLPKRRDIWQRLQQLHRMRSWTLHHRQHQLQYLC